MANPLYDQKMIAEFIRVSDPIEYVYESAFVENTTGAAVNLLGLPYPVKAGTGAGFVEVMTSVEANTTADIIGFLVTNRKEEIAATTGVSMMQYAYVTNGPAVISQEAYVVDDLAGTPYTTANFDTFCAAATPYIKVASSATALTQTPYAL